MARGESWWALCRLRPGLLSAQLQLRSAWEAGTCRPRRLGRAGANAALVNATSPDLTRNADTPSRNHLTRPQDIPSLAHRMVKMPPAPDGKIYSATYSNVCSNPFVCDSLHPWHYPHRQLHCCKYLLPTAFTHIT